MVLKPGREAEAEAIFRKWELDFAVIGRVTDTGHMVLKWNGEVAADIPLAPLADDAPLLRPALGEDRAARAARRHSRMRRHRRRPAEADGLARPRQPRAGSGSNMTRRSAPTPSSRRAATRPWSASTAPTRRSPSPPIARRATARPIPMKAASRRSPRRGATSARSAPARSAATDCMNFGNPQRPEIMGQFVGCIEGMAEACRALDFPIVERQRLASTTRPRREDGAEPGDPADAGDRRRRPDRGLEEGGRHRLQGRRRRHRRDRRPPRPSRPVALAARAARPRGRRRRRRSTCSPSMPRASSSAPPSPAARSPPATTSPTAASPSRSPKWRWPAASAR